MQQYLGIRNGSIYRKEKLVEIGGRIRELPYLQEKQPFNLTMLGTGSILNRISGCKKKQRDQCARGTTASQRSTRQQQAARTGEATINLKNSLGGGETIGVNWQQLQVKSPRLDVVFQQPYLFGSPFGLNFNFDLFKKDSSYVNVSILVGAAYAVSARQTGSVFLQRLSSNLLTVDTNSIKASKQLPNEADVSSVNLGVNYEVFSTDYRFNPRKGSELSISASAGTKNIRKNNVIVKLTDNNDPTFDFNKLYDTFQLKSYQFRMKVIGARYFPIGRAGTIQRASAAAGFKARTFSGMNFSRSADTNYYEDLTKKAYSLRPMRWPLPSTVTCSARILTWLHLPITARLPTARRRYASTTDFWEPA